MNNVIVGKRVLRLFAAWCFTIIMCAGMSIPAHAGLFGVSEQDEIDAGQKVAQQAYKEYGPPLSKNDPMSLRVQAIGMRFAKLSERKNIPYSYQVLKNDKVLNAFAAPGGPVFVTTKLMNTVSNDAELAFVLGHETAHIDRKHIVSAVEKQQKVALGVGILGAIFGYGDSNTFQAFSNVAFTVWSKGYSRDQESEADAYGIRWMSQLGFNPEASLTMFEKLGGSESGIGQYLSDHPSNSSRAQAAIKEIKDENLEEVARKAGGPSLSASNLPAFKGMGRDFSNDIYAMSTPNDGEQLSEPIIAVQNGNSTIILAAVGPFAHWAGTTARFDGDAYIVSLGNNSIRMRINSNQAVINGRNKTLSVPTQIYQNYLYAPVGDLAEGVGGTVTW
ncbi:MAG: M48 family metalloprotease, partial [Abditibacteriaceae bacterium]